MSARQDYEREVARLRAKGGGFTDEQIESLARRNVAFASGPKTPVVCGAVGTPEGQFLAVVTDAKTGERVAEGATWAVRSDATYQAREIAAARGLDPVQG